MFEWLLRRFLGEDDARVLLSELRERYEGRRSFQGADAARMAFRWETRRALGLAVLARVRSEPPSPDLEQIYLRHFHSQAAFMDNLWQDLRFGARSLRRRPLFSAIAILTLGLGIGSATAVFSVVEGVLLRPLPFARPHELVTVNQAYPEWLDIEALRDDWDRNGFSQPIFQQVLEGQRSFTGIAAYRLTTGTLVEQDQVTRLSLGVGSSYLFSVLGITPVLGRSFLPQEDGPAATRVTLISQEIWQERFGADPDILGRQVNLSGQTFTIVGVLPAGFELRNFAGAGAGSNFSRGFWVPLGLDAESFRYGSDRYQGIARLRPGVTRARAEEEATMLIRLHPRASTAQAKVRDLTEAWTGAYRRPLGLLFGAALVLLLIACGNVATLLLGEAPGRQGEMTTRRALGAGGERLSRQLLTECLLLGVAGSAVGVVFAFLGSGFLAQLAPPIPRLDEVGMNEWVLLFSVAVGILTSLVFGSVPVLLMARGRVGENSCRGIRTVGHRSAFFHRAVVSGEVALTVLLLVAGGLLARTLLTLLDVDTGFQQEGSVEARVFLPAYLTADPDRRPLLYREMVDALEAVPGVLGVSATSSLPFSGSLSNNVIRIFRSSGEENGMAQSRTAYAGFFRTMGIPVLRGREFTEADREGTLRVAVISRLMAQRYWPGEDPIGARFTPWPDTFTVVGVVGDVRHASLRDEALPTFYLAGAQLAPPSALSLVVRTAREPEPLLSPIREAIGRVHSRAPITRLEPVRSLVSESARDDRFRAVLFTVFSLVGTLLAAGGVFGVTARGVEARRGEMGLRMALGAEDGHLMRIALLPGLVAGLVGLLVGLASALGASRLLASFLFGVEPWDLPTYGVVALAVLGISLAATYLPSRKIRLLDPATLLREE